MSPAGRRARGRRGYSIRSRQCVRKLPGNTWAWCRDKCTLAFAYFSPARFPYPPGRRSILRSDPIYTCPPSASLASLLFSPFPPAPLSRVACIVHMISKYRENAAEDKNGGQIRCPEYHIYDIIIFQNCLLTRFKRRFARCTLFGDISSVFSKNLRSIKIDRMKKHAEMDFIEIIAQCFEWLK